MTHMQDELERALAEQLHRQVDDLPVTPLSLADVKRGAVRHRRNRRLGTGAGMAAALAMAVPTVATSGALVAGDDRPAPPERQVATLSLSGLERGADPEVEYFTPDGVVLPGRGVMELPYSYNALVPSTADGGWIAWEGAGLGLRYLSEDLEPQGGSATNYELVTNPDRSLAAWTMPEAGAQTLTLHSTLQPGEGATWDFPAAPEVDPVDFVSHDSLVFETYDGRRTTIGIAGPDGSTTPLPGYVEAISASPVTGLVAVQTEEKANGSGCFGLVDPSSPDEPQWQTCEHSLGGFSPDGRYVLASEPRLSGLGVPSVAVLATATGDVVAEFDRPSGSDLILQQLVWESSESFLGIAAEGDRVTMLRFGVDGTLEEAVEPVDGGGFGDLPISMGQDRVRGF